MDTPSKKHYLDRIPAAMRTRSLRKLAGSKALKRVHGGPKREKYSDMLSGEKPKGIIDSPPMNLGPNSNFLDIDELFGASAFMRTLAGRPQLAKLYT